MKNKLQGKGYCNSLFNYQRNSTLAVQIGTLQVGGTAPVSVQSMTTTNTLDTEATVTQAKKIIEAGGDVVRMTTQGRREAANLINIKQKLRQMGYTTPLVADIHFNPNAALIAAEAVEKVRINPGNYADGAKKFENIAYTDSSYQEELQNIKTELLPLIDICKKHQTALRIGTNHGSLSDRIMSRYGDTPEGMVAACMEFLIICKELDFYNIVLSIKASNTRIMVHTVRLLVKTMNENDMNFPLHLGVTEAGEGEDGRLKSAVGTGALLVDGLGDTIRISLTENPENEIPVGRKLVNYISSKTNHAPIEPVNDSTYHPFNYVKRVSHSIGDIGGENLPIVIADKRYASDNQFDQMPDFVLMQSIQHPHFSEYLRTIIPYTDTIDFESYPYLYPLFKAEDNKNYSKTTKPFFIECTNGSLTDSFLSWLKQQNQAIVLISSENENCTADIRAAFLKLAANKITNPVIICQKYQEDRIEDFQIKSGADLGLLFLDGFGDGIMLSNKGTITNREVVQTAFGLLQAARVRFSKTEFISCPGCGRTLFGLQETTAKIKSLTSHLKGLKIGIMGCIVNGPGEMADADYGYVGSGPGKITLYRQKEVVKRNLSSEDAVNELIQLIKEDGKWVQP